MRKQFILLFREHKPSQREDYDRQNQHNDNADQAPATASLTTVFFVVIVKIIIIIFFVPSLLLDVIRTRHGRLVQFRGTNRFFKAAFFLCICPRFRLTSGFLHTIFISKFFLLKPIKLFKSFFLRFSTSAPFRRLRTVYLFIQNLHLISAIYDELIIHEILAFLNPNLEKSWKVGCFCCTMFLSGL